MMAGVSPWRLGTGTNGLPLRWCPVFPWSTLITGIWHELENPGLSRGFSEGVYRFSINFVHRKRCRISLSRFTITAWWYILTMPSLFHHFTLVESKESKVMILFRNSFCAWRKDLDCFISPKKLKQDRLGIHVSIGERTESGERHGSCNTGLCKEICSKATRFIRILDDFGHHRSATECPKKGCTSVMMPWMEQPSGTASNGKLCALRAPRGHPYPTWYDGMIGMTVDAARFLLDFCMTVASNAST